MISNLIVIPLYNFHKQSEGERRLHSIKLPLDGKLF